MSCVTDVAFSTDYQNANTVDSLKDRISISRSIISGSKTIINDQEYTVKDGAEANITGLISFDVMYYQTLGKKQTYCFAIKVEKKCAINRLAKFLILIS